ncbi:S8 family serine peptidase [Phytomonospora endophytica]|uniref:Type VII secretion-associated serine protease mycosin n=1 Tax=Phytomonospora endophytica TaxID=714109 RepID=A0A841FJD0_9ACTN|nr:S8 family serine peptidase [Phytomonospora endophytica]MBB6037431.1 type VII secretion-associated serine protease mycosin [Phytomonospora endophytica]GIG70680.1 type VII secretion-associated serine protease [Phytomonospora endophytica]
MRGSLARVASTAAAVLLVLPAAPAQGREETVDWYLGAMSAERAQRLAKGDGVTIAVIDTGVDGTHPDLAGRVLPGATVDHAGVVDENLPGDVDLSGHGTAMAGLIAGLGIGDGAPLGVAPLSRILPVRVTRADDGTLDPEHVYAGVRWAIAQGAKVVSLSLSGKPTGEAPWKSELIEHAIAEDVVLVAAAGNRSDVEVRVGEPASIPGVVAVSGLGRDGSVWPGSVTGGPVVLSAPAEDLPHLTVDGGCERGSGTSGAAALVAGVAGLIRSRYPDASAADVVNRLIRTAHDGGSPGRDPGFGFGSVDAYDALTATVAPTDRYPLDVPEQLVVEPAPPSADGIGTGWWLLGGGSLLGTGTVAWVAFRRRARTPASR